MVRLIFDGLGNCFSIRVFPFPRYYETVNTSHVPFGIGRNGRRSLQWIISLAFHCPAREWQLSISAMRRSSIRASIAIGGASTLEGGWNSAQNCCNAGRNTFKPLSLAFLADEAREMGAVALDVGSLMDYMVDQKTRTIADII